MTQAEFGQLVGISQPTVSELCTAGVLPAGGTALEWLRAYCGRLREQAAGRLGEGGGLDLVQERAALARSQREHYDLKNAVTRGEYAPIGALTDVLAKASGAIADRLDALPARLRQRVPNLPTPARDLIAEVVADARNEWIRQTADIVVRHLFPDDEDDAAGPGEAESAA